MAGRLALIDGQQWETAGKGSSLQHLAFPASEASPQILHLSTATAPAAAAATFLRPISFPIKMQCFWHQSATATGDNNEDIVSEGVKKSWIYQ